MCAIFIRIFFFGRASWLRDSGEQKTCDQERYSCRQHLMISIHWHLFGNGGEVTWPHLSSLLQKHWQQMTDGGVNHQFLSHTVISCQQVSPSLRCHSVRRPEPPRQLCKCWSAADPDLWPPRRRSTKTKWIFQLGLNNGDYSRLGGCGGMCRVMLVQEHHICLSWWVVLYAIKYFLSVGERSRVQ